MLARPIDGTAFIAPVMDPISPHDLPLCWLYRSCETLRSHRTVENSFCRSTSAQCGTANLELSKEEWLLLRFSHCSKLVNQVINSVIGIRHWNSNLH
jgi:hypothetical protein